MSSPKQPQTPAPPLPPSSYPGERLGLPEHGRGSVGRAGRRIVALIIDGLIADGLSYFFAHYDMWATLGFFVALQILGMLALGGSIGHRLLGLRLTALPDRRASWWRPALRSLLLGLVVPAIVWDSDQRGFHDKIAGTVLVRY